MNCPECGGYSILTGKIFGATIARCDNCKHRWTVSTEEKPEDKKPECTCQHHKKEWCSLCYNLTINIHNYNTGDPEDIGA